MFRQKQNIAIMLIMIIMNSVLCIMHYLSGALKRYARYKPTLHMLQCQPPQVVVAIFTIYINKHKEYEKHGDSRT